MKTFNSEVSRRSLLAGMAGGAVTLVSGGMPVFAQSPTKLLFMEPFDLALEYIHEMNGVVGGHFKAQGLEVEITNARGTSIAIRAPAGVSYFTVLLFATRGSSGRIW